MRTLLGWIAGAVFAALPMAHADEPIAFDTLVECDIKAGFFEKYHSPRIHKFALAKSGSLSGAILVDEPHLHETWASNIFVSAGNAKGDLSELVIQSCSGKVCSSLRAWKAGKEKKKSGVVQRLPLGEPQPQGEWIPFRIDFLGPREWLVQFGQYRQGIVLPQDIDKIEVRCVGIKGSVRFDLPDKIS